MIPTIICLSMLLLGCVIGYMIKTSEIKSSVVGKLKVDTSDSDGPYLFLELSDNIGFIQQKEYITLKVDVSSYISQN